MKLTVFQANDGDCLLVEGGEGGTMLVDGGRRGSYAEHVAPTLGQMAQEGKKLDVVCISHIDNDHISGIVQMMEDTVDWIAYDYQSSTGNTHFHEPRNPRPPAVQALWHNAFRDQVDLNLGDIEDLLVMNMQACLMEASLAMEAEFYVNLLTGEKEALRVSSLVGPQLLKIPVNPEFDARLMLRSEPPATIPLGTMQVHLLGPTQDELDTLRTSWNNWVTGHKTTIDDLRERARRDAEHLPQGDSDLLRTATLLLAAELRQQSAEPGDRAGVTPPNLASLMFLVEEGDKTILLTGDGHTNDIHAGLEAHEKLSDAQGMHIDVFKVPHHGAEYNLTEEFCQYVTADHYVFCGASYKHGNPDLEILQAIVDSRLGDEAATSKSLGVDRPFKFWFSCSSESRSLSAKSREYMEKVEDATKKAAGDSQGKMEYHFITDESRFEITL